jgi:hypothetical protein
MVLVLPEDCFYMKLIAGIKLMREELLLEFSIYPQLYKRISND